MLVWKQGAVGCWCGSRVLWVASGNQMVAFRQKKDATIALFPPPFYRVAHPQPYTPPPPPTHTHPPSPSSLPLSSLSPSAGARGRLVPALGCGCCGLRAGRQKRCGTKRLWPCCGTCGTAPPQTPSRSYVRANTTCLCLCMCLCVCVCLCLCKCVYSLDLSRPLDHKHTHTPSSTPAPHPNNHCCCIPWGQLVSETVTFDFPEWIAPTLPLNAEDDNVRSCAVL